MICNIIRALASLMAALAVGCGGAERPEETVSTRVQTVVAEPLVVVENAVNTRALDNRLFELASMTDNEIRQQVAIAVGRIGDGRGMPILVRLMSDSDPKVRREAAFAASRFDNMPSKGLLDSVRSCLAREQSIDVLTTAIFASSKIETISGLEPAISHFLYDPRLPIRIAALEAVGRLAMRGASISPKTQDAIDKALADPQDMVRVAAAFATSTSSAGGPHILSALGRTLQFDSSAEARIFAAKALVRRGVLDEVLLFGALADRDYRVGVHLLETLRGIPDPARCDFVSKVLPWMLERLRDNPEMVSSLQAHILYTALDVSTECTDLDQIKRTSRAMADYLETAAAKSSGIVASIRCLALQISSDDDLEILSCHISNSAMGKVMLIERLARKATYTAEEETILQELLLDSDLTVATAAVRALLSHESSFSEKRVSSLLSDDRIIVVSEALRQIALNPNRFVDPIVSGEPVGHSGLIAAIRKVVMRFMPFDSVILPQIYAAKVLGGTNDVDVEPILRRLASDTRPSVREAALDAYSTFATISPPAGLPPIGPTSSSKQAGLETRCVERGLMATFQTNRGIFIIDLFCQTAPQAVTSFIKLVESGYYVNAPLFYGRHDLVIDAGDPTSTGCGDSGFSVTSELCTVPFERGTIGMDPVTANSIGSRLFIALSRRPDLDGTFVALGRVISDMNIFDLFESGTVIKSISISASH